MAGASAQRVADIKHDAVDLFGRIGIFLCEQHLSPDPQHYAFAYRVLTEAQGTLARIVAERTEGGVRLLRHDIEQLGGSVSAGAPATDTVMADKASAAEGLVAQTQMQVEDFSDMVQAMRAETEDFGRNLAASADAMRDTRALDPNQVVRLTADMLQRVRSAETRLEAATQEASELRVKLEEARDNARRDPLTGLPNRRAFEEAFATRMANGDTMCVAVCDVDHFKTVNDRFGHAVGDRVLKAIADALSAGCAGHLVARYGGEEFAILFHADLASARAILDDARCTVAGKRYRLRGSDEPLGEVTFSAGLASAAAGETLGTVFGRADGLLYAAKSAGRNQLKVA